MNKLITVLLDLFAGPRVAVANIATGTHIGALTLKADATSATENLLVKFGSSDSHFAIAGASDKAIGTQLGTPDAGDFCAIGLLGAAASTRFMVASAAIGAGKIVVQAADGEIAELSATPGTYYQVGVSLSAALSKGETVEVDPCPATPVVVT